MQIQIDITEVAGPKLADLRNIGLVPDALDGRNLHVSNPSGSRIVVRDYEDDSVILASGNGWSNAMQALADHYGVPVQVSRDYGVTGGKSGKVLGFWSPATPADAPVAPTAKGPHGVAAKDAPVGQLINIVDNEWAPVVGVAITQDGQRAVISYGNGDRVSRLTRYPDETVRVMRGADVKLTKAQAELVRQVADQLVSFRPSNADWAPSHARRGDMFELSAGRRRVSNRTLSGNALDALGFLAYNRGQHYIVELTEPAKQWLAAHPA